MKERLGGMGTVFTLLADGSTLTSGQAAVRAAQVDVALRDGGGAQLVVGTSEEGGQSAGKHDVPVTGRTSHGNTDLRRRHALHIIIHVSFMHSLHHLNFKYDVSKVIYL